MSFLDELDQIRSDLSGPGKPFEFTTARIGDVDLPVYKFMPPNITHTICQAKQFGAREFVVDGERRLTYADILGQAGGLARILTAQYHIGQGKRVAVAMRNSPECIVAYLAVLLAGATAVAVNSRGARDEMRHAVQDTECSLLIADDKRAALLESAHLCEMLVAKGSVFEGRNREPLVIEPVEPEPSSVAPDDAALILFTSGTTGRPKGAVLTHRNVGTFLYGLQHHGATMLAYAAQQANCTLEALRAMLPQTATFGIFPLFHVSGICSMVLGAMQGGGKIVMLERWDPVRALALAEREKITMLQGPPSVLWDVLNSPAFAESDLRSLTNVGIGGQATPLNLIDALNRALPSVALGTGFGMTETTGSIAASMGPEFMANPKSAGRIMPGVLVRVLDEHGHEVPQGGVGEIWVRGALVMAGYWNNPDANEEVLVDGWLRTGDIGFVDQDRYITIVDRKKDVVIRGGENIYCAELERVFQSFPGVFEVAAFGVPDERWGERVVLAVVPQPGETLAVDEILAHGASRLADYKRPSEVFFTPPFERNVVGKIDKIKLRKAYLERQ